MQEEFFKLKWSVRLLTKVSKTNDPKLMERQELHTRT